MDDTTHKWSLWRTSLLHCSSKTMYTTWSAPSPSCATSALLPPPQSLVFSADFINTPFELTFRCLIDPVIKSDFKVQTQSKMTWKRIDRKKGNNPAKPTLCNREINVSLKIQWMYLLACSNLSNAKKCSWQPRLNINHNVKKYYLGIAVSCKYRPNAPQALQNDFFICHSLYFGTGSLVKKARRLVDFYNN